MASDERTDKKEYNLEGGQRHVLVIHGVVRAVAPGLRLVEPTDGEQEPYREAPQPPQEYGLPV